MSRGSKLRPIAAAVLAAGLLVTIQLSRGALEGPFRIDEAHKLSETLFLRLLLEGRFDDPAWFGHIVDRTNPPAGKYLLGFGLLVQGKALPQGPTLSVLSRDGSIPPTHTAAESEPYRPLLRAGRRTALAATALTAAIIGWVVARSGGSTAAAAAILVFLFSFPVAGWGATAIFDPFLALMVVAPLPLLLGAGESGRREALARAAAAGALCGVALQVRISGGVSLIALLAVAAWIFRSRKRFLAAVTGTVVLCAAVTAIAINPYYWSSAADPRFSGGALFRVPQRIALQLEDLGRLFSLVAERAEVLATPLAKARYVAEIAFGDVIGLAALVLILGAFATAPRLISRSGDEVPLLIWAAVVVVVYGGWLPLAWPRYILPLMPALAILAGIGAGEIASLLRRKFDSGRRAA